MKTTQKNLIEVFKRTKNAFTVISFDENDKRYSTYGGIDLLTAMKEIMMHLKIGRKVIVTDSEGAKMCRHYEYIVTNTRIPYSEAKHFSIDLNFLVTNDLL